MKKLEGMVNMFTILITVMVLQGNNYVKIYQIVFKYVQFTVCQIYFNKPVGEEKPLSFLI